MAVSEGLKSDFIAFQALGRAFSEICSGFERLRKVCRGYDIRADNVSGQCLPLTRSYRSRFTPFILCVLHCTDKKFGENRGSIRASVA